MKKRILGTLLIGILLIGLTGCGNSNNNDSTSEKNDSIQAYEINEEFKKAMDSYEEFIDEYVDILKKYQDSNGTDASILTDYFDYISKYADYVEDFEKWESKNLNAKELKYYTEVQARVAKKLLEISNYRGWYEK